MKKKRARVIAGSLCGILAAASPLQSAATTTMSRVAGGISYADYAVSGREGYSVTGTDASALSGDTVVIPDFVDGKAVIHLDSNFLSGSGAKRVELGSKIAGMNADAFFEAKDLEEIVTHSKAFTVSEDDPALYTYQHSFLLDYPSAASDGGDYAVHEGTKVIYSMDNASFGKLDLRQADTLAKHVLAGTTASELAIAANARTTTGSGSTRLSLPGLHAGSFSVTDAGSGAYLQSDGDSLYTDDGALIKLASGVMDGVDWGRYREIDTDAFDSMSQYWSLSGSIPESLKKDKVFHFYNQDNGVFIVNDQTAFCYNSDRHIPDRVADGADFSSIIDGENYDKVSAVMFVGVPYNGTGLFEEIFGIPYEDALRDAGMSRNGDAALNAVSSMIWELVDGRPADIIDGIGGTSYFTEENVRAYTEALRKAASNAGSYTFSPVFEIDGNVLTFREQDDGTFLSDPFKVSAVDGNGVRNDSYKIKMTLSGDGFGIYGGSGMDFMSGTEIRITSQGKPEGQPLSFTYEKGSLKYYAPGGAGEQNLLVSGTKTEGAAIQYAFEVKPAREDLVISKRAAGGSEELPGASLKLTGADNTVMDEWISGSEPHTVSMPDDGIYTLTETTAPDGYEVAESITFEVRDGKVEGGMVIMYDAPKARETAISKKDLATSEELPGASLKLTDSGGGTVDEWVSEDTHHVVKDLADGTYTLTETTAPDGYEVAENITFEVRDGKVEGGMVVMYDAPKEKEEPNFQISKHDAATGEELPGASLKLMDATGKVVEEWVSKDTPHEVKSLADGTYTLTETTAPDGYKIAESITFEVKDGKVEGGKVVMYDAPKEDVSTPSEPEKPSTPSEPEKPNTPSEPEKPGKPEDKPGEQEKDEGYFYISKRDAANSNELSGARLKVTDADSDTVAEWTSTDAPRRLMGIEDGTYTLTEVTAPRGYDVAESITFTVKDGRVDGGTVVMYDRATARKTFSGSGGGGRSSGGSDITHGPGITPQATEAGPQPVTPSPEPAPTPTPAQESSQLPKTDDLPASILAFWAAALTLAGLLADRKKYQLYRKKA